MNPDLFAQRAELIRQMAALSTMELGSIKAEYRTGPSGERLGPYYKHQVWEQGANLSRRVPPEEASALEQAIHNRQQFECLATRFIDLTVRLTREGSSYAAQKKTSPHAALLRRRRSPN